MNSLASMPPPTKPGIAVVEIADGDGRAGPEVVVGFVVEQADGAGVGVALQISADPVVAIAQSVGEQPAFGIQQQARGFDRRAETTTTMSAVCSCRRPSES